MRLKKIEICGFKSFADRVTLHFDCGISAIVGPNGCGKSNVADALRWVLGEQSAKSVRGDRMFDVIFAGAGTRKPLNYAEVSIVLTEIKGALPIDFEEIEIKRRLYRSGESEYSLNGHIVRLKDIQNLLWDSGNAFSQIGQGQMDKMITLKPVERRYIFDEAAGISRFRKRRQESQDKLSKTSENIDRVEDIHQEVHKQKDVLERQSQEALEYKDNKEKLDTLEKAVLWTRWNHFEKERIEKEENKHNLDGKQKKLNEELEAGRKELSICRTQLHEIQKVVEKRKEEFFRLRGDTDLKQMELRSIQDKKKETHETEHLLALELKALDTQLKEELKNFQINQKQLEKQVKLVAQAEAVLHKRQGELQNFEEGIRGLREEQKVLQLEHLQAVQQEHTVKAQLSEVSLRLESLGDKAKDVQRKQASLHTLHVQLQETETEKSALVQELSTKIDTIKEQLKTGEVEWKQIRGLLEKAELENKRIQKELSEHLARKKALQSLKEDLEGLNDGAKVILKESRKKGSTLFEKVTPLYEEIVPKEGCEEQVSAALYRYLHTLVIKTRADQKKVWEFVQERKIKDCSLFCLEDLDTTTTSSDALIDFVEATPIALHFLKNIAQDASSGGECITAEGRYRDLRSVEFFWRPGNQNVFLRETELKRLDEKLVVFEKQKQEIETELQRLIKRSQLLQQEKIDYDKEQRKLEMKLVEANFSLQHARGEAKRSKKEHEDLVKEGHVIQTSEKELSSKKITLKESHEKIQTLLEGKEKHRSSLENKLQERIDKLEGNSTELKKLEEELKTLTYEQHRLEHECKIFEIKKQEKQRQQTKIQSTLAEQSSGKEKIQNRLETVIKELEACQQAVKDGSNNQKEAEKQEGICLKKLQQTDQTIKRLEKDFQKFEQDAHKLELTSTQLQSSREMIIHDLKERFEMTVEELKVLNLKLKLSLEEAEKEIRGLRQRVEKAKNINMASIDEFKAVQERFEHIDKQLGDLNSSKKELQTIIEELDQESRRLFEKTFQEIRDNFRKNFVLLFSGGEADLKLVDSKDVLEAGIEIIAKPPGKQMRSITLLSGGEKCMTAIALLFALFEAKAAPFCMLDEIDAPLDDANVERFVNLVKQFVGTTQFIVITHNKRTMAAADRLYGITMQEKGVSKLLSMSFKRDIVGNGELVTHH